MTEAIARTLELSATVATVWRALTEPAELARWFGDSAELDLRPGGEGWFGWSAHGRFAVRVEELDPPRRFAWRWGREAGKALAETASTLVEWTLVPRGDGGTTLHLRESGFAAETYRRQNEEGWREELAHLAALLEGAP